MMIFHNYIKKVRSLEKGSFLSLLISKNNIFLKKYLFLQNLDIIITYCFI
jgi:hypothetical protein